MQPDAQAQINHILELVQSHFWQRGDFWVFVVLSILSIGVSGFGLWYSIRAFKEAEQAKVQATQAKAAAKEAGKIVRVQTVAIELGEISQKLEKLEPDILFSEARELLAEISRKLLRSISPYAEDSRLKSKIAAVKAAIEATQNSMKEVRPTPGTPEVRGSVYNGIEADLRTVNNLVAELLGLFETRGFDSGEEDA
jgi:multidrug resistance efflux pump